MEITEICRAIQKNYDNIIHIINSMSTLITMKSFKENLSLLKDLSEPVLTSYVNFLFDDVSRYSINNILEKENKMSWETSYPWKNKIINK